jgi:hypothetical protein
MVFGPTEYQGVGLTNIFHEMMHRHVKTILTEGDRDTVTGHLLRSSIEQHHMETGWGGSLFEQPLDILEPCTTKTWVRETWRYLRTHSLRLQDATGRPTLRRENDQFLMRTLVSTGYRGAQLRRLNQCRMYLQCTVLSDITSGDGRRLLSWAWEGLKQTNHPSPFSWPRASNPTRADWGLWRQALRKSFGFGPRAEKRLGQPLGSWLSSTASDKWDWFLVTEDNRVYRQHEGQWLAYVPNNYRRRHQRHKLYRLQGPTQAPNDPARTVVEGVTDLLVRATGTSSILDSSPIF